MNKKQKMMIAAFALAGAATFAPVTYLMFTPLPSTSQKHADAVQYEKGRKLVTVFFAVTAAGLFAALKYHTVTCAQRHAPCAPRRLDHFRINDGGQKTGSKRSKTSDPK